MILGTSLTAIAMAIAQSAAAQDTAAATPAQSPAVCPTANDPNALCTPPGSADDAGIAEVVVHGVRSSVESAIGIKRNSQEIIDSIVAEDIGKLPDNSVAAALQRVTGVQVERANGEVSTVLIRGLPDVVTTLNGRDVFTTTGRSISLADIPADLLQRVDVYKTMTAEQPEGGIAGTIDVRLHRPFDFEPGLKVAGGLREVYSEQADKYDPVGSLTVSNRWKNDWGEFGALASYSYQRRRYQESSTFNFISDLVDNPANPGQEIYRPETMGAIYNIGDRDRRSGNISLQWRPNDNTELYFDGLAIGYDERRQANYWIPLPVLVDSSNVVDVTLRGDTNVAQTMEATNLFTLTSNQGYRNSSDTFQGSLGGLWENDSMKLSSELTHTYSSADNRDFIVDTAFIAPDITMNFSNGGAADATVRNADGSAFDLTDSSNYWVHQYYDDWSHQRGSEWAWKGDSTFHLNFGPVDKFDAGLRFSRRMATNVGENSGGKTNNRSDGELVYVDSIPGLAATTPNNLLDGARDMSTRQWTVADRDFIMQNSDEIRSAMGYDTGTPAADPSLYFNDREDNYAFYAQAHYLFDVGSLPLDGFVGARVVRLNSTLRGTQIDGDTGDTAPVSIDKHDTEVLPTLNARLKFTPDLFLRGAYGRTITRPSFANLNPQLTLYQATATVPATGSGGNPDLDAVKSNNVDISLEWYFAPGGELAATTFYRGIKGYIQTYSSTETIDGTDYNVSMPQNTGHGTLKGVELQYVQFFDMLPGWMSGFGTQLNATFISAQTESPEGVDQDLVNVSKRAYNAILMYEKYGFSARVAYNWRSKYVSAYDPGGDQPQEIDIKPSDNLDAQVSYDISEHFTVSLEGTNLMREVSQTYFGNSYQFPRDTARLERTFTAGMRFRF
ncbi:TonB-dependent receptor [Solimonas sp. C16B3]|uniref:TonB-dependent receptor n=2 Tax=Solimonas marina TaxID=2714601 RepID=A0A969WCW0_9GAMM|nr:TonB-dependent receptor [Solimonas marina]